MTTLRMCFVITIAVPVSLAGCRRDVGETAASADASAILVVDETPEVLVTVESGMLARVGSVLAHSNGRVYLADIQDDQVHVVSSDGVHVRSIGEPGAGPGEFNTPFGVFQLGDTVAVADINNLRLQLFDSEGNLVGQRPLPVPGVPVLGPTGVMVTPTGGSDSTLALVHRPDGAEMARIGSTTGEPRERTTVTESKQAIREGRLPHRVANEVQPVVDSDASVWLVMPGRAVVERYRPQGTLEWSVTLSEPEFPHIWEEVVTRNEVEPNWVPTVRYFSYSGHVLVGGDLWVLLGSSIAGPATIRVVRRSGEIGPRIEFPQVSRVDLIGVDEGRGYVYFSSRESADLRRVRVDFSALDQ